MGPEGLTLREIVAKYWNWLGLGPALELFIPLLVMRALGRVADLAGGGPMGSAGLQQLLAGNIGREPSGVFERAIGFRPTSMDERLAERPAGTQDLWHARLYFLKPLLRLTLIALWLGSAIVGVLTPVDGYAAVANSLAEIGLPPGLLAIGFSLLDLAIAVALLLRLRPRLLAGLQVVVVLSYTFGLCVLAPSLWLDPYGAPLKNLAVLAAIGVWAALEEEER